ncbi:MAG: DHH family phosphoesterase [Candidatus Lokiarchaeota archaeon]
MDKDQFFKELDKTKNYFLANLTEMESSVHIYTHLDADGLSAGAILGKSLYRMNIPFQITILKQLEKDEIIKISEKAKEFGNFFIFADFGSGQYSDIKKEFTESDAKSPFIILDHHLPQEIESKDKLDEIKSIFEETRPWHINPYFFGIDGSSEVSGAGLSYFFSKNLNDKNIDLSPIALIGAVGDIQNQGGSKTFLGLNKVILKDALDQNLISERSDLNFSLIKPLNQALAYSTEINLPGISGDENKSLKFLKQLGVLIEKPNGEIKTLNDLTWDEKQKISSAIIEYASVKLNINPNEIIEKLIVNRYLLTSESEDSDLRDLGDFSNLLNACGRTNNGAQGIAITMGDRSKAYKEAKEKLEEYKKSLVKALTWLKEENKIKNKDYIQYFYGEDIIPENIVGTISSMLIFDNDDFIDKNKPIFGYANRLNEDVYKVSGRAHKSLVKKGINLSEAIRKALKRSDLITLGGGHPPAAGTKVPTNKIDEFLKHCNEVIKEQLE